MKVFNFLSDYPSLYICFLLVSVLGDTFHVIYFIRVYANPHMKWNKNGICFLGRGNQWMDLNISQTTLQSIFLKVRLNKSNNKKRLKGGQRDIWKPFIMFPLSHGTFKSFELNTKRSRATNTSVPPKSGGPISVAHRLIQHPKWFGFRLEALDASPKLARNPHF